MVTDAKNGEQMKQCLLTTGHRSQPILLITGRECERWTTAQKFGTAEDSECSDLDPNDDSGCCLRARECAKEAVA